MTSIIPFLYTQAEEYIPELGYDWVVRSQTIDSLTKDLTSRTFSVIEFSSIGNLEFRDVPPPGYPDSDITSYYAVKRIMTDNRYEAENSYTQDSDDPLYIANDFYGWKRTEVIYTHEAWYLDQQGVSISWVPEQVGLDIPVFTGNYIFTVIANNALQTTGVTPADQTSIVVSTGQYWGARLQNLSGDIKADLIDNPNSNEGISLESQSPLLLNKTYIRITRKDSLSAIAVGLYGIRWLGNLTFNTINQSTWLYHSPQTDTAIRLKPPGLSYLSDTFDSQLLPDEPLANRTESVGLL